MKSLIGRTVIAHKQIDWDYHGDGQRVGELHTFTLDGGEEVMFICEGGDTSFYATISEVSQQELDEIAREGGGRSL